MPHALTFLGTASFATVIVSISALPWCIIRGDVSLFVSNSSYVPSPLDLSSLGSPCNIRQSVFCQANLVGRGGGLAGSLLLAAAIGYMALILCVESKRHYWRRARICFCLAAVVIILGALIHVSIMQIRQEAVRSCQQGPGVYCTFVGGLFSILCCGLSHKFLVGFHGRQILPEASNSSAAQKRSANVPLGR